jgi:hypothetical protein
MPLLPFIRGQPLSPPRDGFRIDACRLGVVVEHAREEPFADMFDKPVG